jgi:hypothetical protein
VLGTSSGTSVDITTIGTPNWAESGDTGLWQYRFTWVSGQPSSSFDGGTDAFFDIWYDGTTTKSIVKFVAGATTSVINIMFRLKTDNAVTFDKDVTFYYG